MQRAMYSVRNDFPFGDNDSNSIEINIIFGVTGVDQEGTDFFDPKDVGEVVYDNTFNPAPE